MTEALIPKHGGYRSLKSFQVAHIGQITRDPMRKSMIEKFFEVGDIENKVMATFPNERQRALRDNATKIAKVLGRSLRGDELSDPQAVNDMVELSLLLAPLQTLDEKLRVASESELTPLNVVSDILRTARVAETVTFGRLVEKRLDIIQHLEQLKDIEETQESELQTLIESAPWLINPQWVQVTANVGLKRLKAEFVKYFKEKTGQDIVLGGFDEPSKRPDFVLFSQDGLLQIIEIKRPKHSITNTEMDRIINYLIQFDAFLADSKHEEFRTIANGYHLTLVSDGQSLTGAQKISYNSYIEKKIMTHIDWSNFLLRTTKMHQEFLAAADELKLTTH